MWNRTTPSFPPVLIVCFIASILFPLHAYLCRYSTRHVLRYLGYKSGSILEQDLRTKSTTMQSFAVLALLSSLPLIFGINQDVLQAIFRHPLPPPVRASEAFGSGSRFNSLATPTFPVQKFNQLIDHNDPSVGTFIQNWCKHTILISPK
jgi:hypothetical protein